MHIVQWQRNENGVGADFAFDALIYDADGTEIGVVEKASIDATTKSLSVDSNLPDAVVITASGGDADLVQFQYEDQTWMSNDATVHFSNLGSTKNKGYENGKREGDMGFTC